MIIWLASYPRSGNTLLRLILKQCFDLNSYDAGDPAKPIFAKGVEEIVGQALWDKPWHQAYPEAARSSDLFLVKTHDLPVDSSPAIYVVRTGQAASYSYYRFHQEFHPEEKKSLIDIILGDDVYGDWSSHYAAWNSESSPPRLLLRFEDLVEPSLDLLKQIASFINYRGKIRPWQNPMNHLHKLQPNFFREGRINWNPPPEWTSLEDALFWLFHAPAMHALDYPNEATIPDENIEKMGVLLRHKIRRNYDLQVTCRERLAAIQHLDAICEERLAKIERMKKKIDSLERKKRTLWKKIKTRFSGAHSKPAHYAIDS